MGKMMKMAMMDSQRRKHKEDTDDKKNQIGFQSPYTRETEPVWNGKQNSGGEKDIASPMMGYANISYRVEHNESPEKMTKQQAEQWTKAMKNDDGSQGERWSFSEIENVMKQYGISWELPAFYAAMNMLYSDFGEVFKKYDVATMNFYVDMAKAFLDDKDAVKDKIEKYYRYIAKH